MGASLGREARDQSGRVVGHIAQRVGRRRGATQELEPRDAGAGEVGRAADIAIVEADRAEAAGDQPGEERVPPPAKIQPETHHQQDQWIRAPAALLEAELDRGRNPGVPLSRGGGARLASRSFGLLVHLGGSGKKPEVRLM